VRVRAQFSPDSAPVKQVLKARDLASRQRYFVALSLAQEEVNTNDAPTVRTEPVRGGQRESAAGRIVWRTCFSRSWSTFKAVSGSLLRASMVRAPLLTSCRSASSSSEVCWIVSARRWTRCACSWAMVILGLDARARSSRGLGLVPISAAMTTIKTGHQLVAWRAQRECFEEIDPLQVLDGIAHLRLGHQKLLATRAQLERNGRGPGRAARDLRLRNIRD
jgi:hypothetical protein